MNEILPKVTIVTATFNLIKNGREKFFRKCVESVHNQTYKNIEHFIIDGASNDGTLEIIKDYKDKGWIKYYSEPDDGMCDAMNKGIKMASGEYVAILNSDDYYTEDAIELLIKAIKEKNADYSYSSTNMFSRETDNLFTVWDSGNDVFCRIFLGIPFNHEAMLCKKSVYEKLNYYEYKKYGTAADYYFVLKLILNDYKGSYVNEKAILHFRMDGTTNFSDTNKVSTTALKHIRDYQKVLLFLWSKFLNPYEIYKVKKFLRKSIFTGFNDKCLFYLHKNSILKKYKNFLLKLNLKNFPYDEVDRYVEKYRNFGNNDNYKRYYIFNILPILEIRNKNNKKIVYKLFNFLPLIEIRLKDNKVLYRLFNFIPIFSIKHK